jgi:serine/threonine protein kinase
MTSQPAAETLQGERGVYRVFDWVGGGGFGSVFFGRELGSNRAVALKRLHAHFVHEPRAVARFEREADLVLVRGLRHPNLVRILDRGRDEQGVPFLAMEWIDGSTVADLLTQHGAPLPVADAAAIGCQVLQGLEAAHALSIVHRDIKPSNLMVTGNGHVMVMDLGIAKDTDPDSTSLTGAYSGVPATLQYAAPEQLAGDRPVDGRTDLYALGATLYLVLAGRPPFNGPARPDPVPLQQLRPETDGELAAIVKRALAYEPSNRFATATAMRAALRPFAPSDLRVAVPDSDSEVGPSSASVAVPSRRTGGKSRRLPRVALAAALSVVLIAIIAGAFLIVGQSTQNPPDAAATAASELLKLPAPTTWPVLKNDLSDMTYMGDDAFAIWTSSLENGVLKYQMSAKTAAAYPVPIQGRDVGQTFHYAVTAKQVSGPPTSYGPLLLYPSDAKAADVTTRYYEFVIDNNSNARFALRKDGAWQTLWQSFGLRAVRPGDTNAFVVHAEPASGGTHFTLFLNGQYVADVTDNQLGRSGAVGVVMVLEDQGDAARWEFSDLELRAPRDSP